MKSSVLGGEERRVREREREIERMCDVNGGGGEGGSEASRGS